MWNRRAFLFACAAPVFAREQRPSVAITMDDFAWRSIPEPWRSRANRDLLSALREHGIKAAGFVTGRNVDDALGIRLVREWSDAGHLIGNHTYEHRNFDNLDIPLGDYEADVLRNERLLSSLPAFQKFFRFPMLKEGTTAERRDAMRGFLREHGYRNGSVTIDTSDWLYDQRLRDRLTREPSFDPARFREPYLAHIADRARYYDRLSQAVLGRSVRHTLLIHFNLLNVLFLRDVLAEFDRLGWRLIDAQRAYEDPVFRREPNTLPAGESLIWSLAHETGRFEKELRYPGEDDVYEKPILDRLGL